jgi:hypothetical protein
MNGREALKIIEERIRKGHSKKEIFDELSGQVKFKTDLLQLLAMVPSHENRTKYRTANNVLLVLLSIMTILKLIEATYFFIGVSFYMLPLVIVVGSVPVYFVTMVWKFRGIAYRMLGLLGAVGILQGFSALEIPGLNHYNLFSYLPAVALVFLAFYIGYKAFPYYNFWGILKQEEFEEQIRA